MTISTFTKRQRLFKHSRPLIRKYEAKDNGFLWAAYQKGSLPLPKDLSQEAFLIEVAKRFGGFGLLWIIEDRNRSFKSGIGQVGVVGIKTDGWAFEPEAHFFKWATPKNVLRAAVGFFQMIRHQKDVGICRVEVSQKDKALLDRMKSYGVLYLRGRIPFGSPEGDTFVFSINGKKQ